MDVPSHLLQPLSVNTNISYALDMSLFPGVDDPKQMYEPALLIATDWSQYVAGDIQYVEEDLSEETNPIDDDLFSLIEICDLPSENETNSDGSFQSLVDDLIDETSASSYISSGTPEDAFSIEDSLLETQSFSHVIGESDFKDISAQVCRGSKRQRDFDKISSCPQKTKLSDLSLPPLVSVYPTSNSCLVDRES